MTIPCNYYINVARKTQTYPNGEHYCTIELSNQVFTEGRARYVFDEIKQMFGDEFVLSLNFTECHSREIVRSNQK